MKPETFDYIAYIIYIKFRMTLYVVPDVGAAEYILTEQCSLLSETFLRRHICAPC